MTSAKLVQATTSKTLTIYQ